MSFSHHVVPHIHEGHHHRAHLISTKAIFTYLELLLFFGIFINFLGAKHPEILGSVTFSPSEIISLTNEQRKQNGLGVLTENSQLDKAAEAKAVDMFANDYWAHFSPSGKSPWVFISATGYKYVYAGENLARDFDDPQSVVKAWMESPSHRDNLLDGNFKEIGVAVSEGKLGGREGILVVQMFGSTTSAVLADNLEQSEPLTNSVQGEQTASEVQKPLSIPASGILNNASKTIALALVGFVFVFFVIEFLVSIKVAHLSLKPQVVAHLVFLAVVILAIWYSTTGAII